MSGSVAGRTARAAQYRRRVTALDLTLTVEAAGPAAALLLTDAQVEQLGAGKRAPVVVWIGGRSARLRVAMMGGCAMIGLSRAARAQLQVEIGDRVDVRIEVDADERVVEIPERLAQAFAGDPAAKVVFDALPYTRRKELAHGIRDAKREDTRERRTAAALRELRGE